MKGLLIKDFRLLMQRKRFFLIMALCAVFMGFTMEDAGFVTGWVSILMGVFSLSSLSYDEYDNCMPFLMSMPVTRREYAVEKYLFGFLCGAAGCVFALILELLTGAISGRSLSFSEDLPALLCFLPAVLILISFCLPVELKWGGERGRMVLLVIYGAIFALILAVRKIVPETPEFLEDAGAEVNPWLLLPVLAGISVAVALISAALSVRIVEKKEY